MNDKRTKIEFLDTLFASRRVYSRQDVTERFEQQFQKGLSRRSFFNYMSALRESGAPIECKIEKTDFGSTTYYFYDEKFNLNTNIVNKYDTLKIKSALTVLQQFEHLPQMQDLEEVILKLEEQLSTPNAAESST
jgi:predicted DNA-binding transcriptional regulator YafY